MAIGWSFRTIIYMRPCHVKRHKVSFVESLDNADTAHNRSALGDEDVHFHTGIDDKSSWFRFFRANRRNPARLAGTPGAAAAAGHTDRTRPARCRPVLERHRVRSRKAVLAGLTSSQAGAASV